MATYTYPHVNITTKAKNRVYTEAPESTATTLLAPFACDRGPMNQLVKIDTMADFNTLFGQLDYSKHSQRQILNIGKWISTGGRVLACRISGNDLTYGLYKADMDDVKSDLSGVTVTVKDNVGLIKVSDLSDTLGDTYGKRFVKQLKLHVNAHTYNSASNDLQISFLRFYWQTNSDEATRYSEKNITIAYIPQLTDTDESTVYSAEYAIFIETNEAISESYINLTKNQLGSKNYLASSSSTKLNLIDFLNGFNTLPYDTYIKLNSSNNLCIYNDSTSLINLGINVVAPAVSDEQKSKTAYAEHTVDDHLKFKVVAKYPGSYYNDLDVTIISKKVSNNLTFTISVTDANTKTLLEKMNNVPFVSLSQQIGLSSYIGDIAITKDNAEIDSDSIELSDINAIVIDSGSTGVLFDLDHGTDITNVDANFETLMVSSLKNVLAQPLETPFDVMIDPGYSEATKKELITIFCNESTDLVALSRRDAMLYLTLCEIPYTSNGRNINDIVLTDINTYRVSTINGISVEEENVSFSIQYGKTTDIFSKVSGREVIVPVSYCNSALLAKNDATYGVQYPSAGITRGAISKSDLSWIDHIPTNLQKQEYYNNRINYIEKDSNGQYFMCQLTGTLNDTNLKFTNNVRSLLKMKKEITLIGRRYLHEFNDRITKTNLLNSLNTYMSNWIQNRTLSSANIELYDSTDLPGTVSSEELLVRLTIKFNGLIEVISVDITIE